MDKLKKTLPRRGLMFHPLSVMNLSGEPVILWKLRGPLGICYSQYHAFSKAVSLPLFKEGVKLLFRPPVVPLSWAKQMKFVQQPVSINFRWSTCNRFACHLQDCLLRHPDCPDFMYEEPNDNEKLSQCLHHSFTEAPPGATMIQAFHGEASFTMGRSKWITCTNWDSGDFDIKLFLHVSLYKALKWIHKSYAVKCIVCCANILITLHAVTCTNALCMGPCSFFLIKNCRWKPTTTN